MAHLGLATGGHGLHGRALSPPLPWCARHLGFHAPLNSGCPCLHALAASSAPRLTRAASCHRQESPSIAPLDAQFVAHEHPQRKGSPSGEARRCAASSEHPYSWRPEPVANTATVLLWFRLPTFVSAHGEHILEFLWEPVWFEDWWMVASWCDERLTTLCGLTLGYVLEVQVAAWLVLVQVKNKRERSLPVRPPGVEKTSRLGSRDPMASGVNCGTHGGNNRNMKLWTVSWLSLKTKVEPGLHGSRVVSGDWRMIHRVHRVSSGSPENHWVPCLIRKSQDRRRRCSNIRLVWLVGLTHLTNGVHRYDWCVMMASGVFEAEDTCWDHKACVEAKQVCGRQAFARWCYDKVSQKALRGCVRPFGGVYPSLM
jgi:hypothetical protein